jgi:hypothetical protein
LTPGKLRLLGLLYPRFSGYRNHRAAGSYRKSMGCGVTATLLHAGAVKDGALEKPLGKVVEVSRQDSRIGPAKAIAGWLPAMIEDRLLTWRPETTVNE